MRYFALIGGFVASSCALVERHTTCADGEGIAELFGVLECDLCASRSCCAEATACVADGGCAELVRCFRDCTDESCFRTCRATFPHDAAKLNALLDCVGQCEAPHCVLPERAVTCPDQAPVADVFGTASCDLCIRRTLCDAAASCMGVPECRARMECMTGCVGPNLHPACFDQCRDDDQVDVGDAQFFTTVARDCRSECAIGSDFDCVDAYAWPTTTQLEVAVGYKAINRNTNMGFADLEVTACANNTGPCVAVGMPPTVTTSSTGDVTVTVPSNNGFEETVFSGFRGYLSWEDPTGNRENWLPTILFHTRPEYRDRVADEIAPFGTGTLLDASFQLVANTPPAVTLDTTRAYVLGGVVDCHGSFEFFAQDVALEIEGSDASTRVVYLNKTQSAPDFSATATTEAGQFIVINAPTGSRLVTLRHAITGNVVGDAVIELRPDTATVIAIWPNSK
jgi:hypothetical protein